MGFFDYDYSNHIPDTTSIALKPVQAVIATATLYIQTLGLSEMASYTQDGTQETPIFPWKLIFKPQQGKDFPLPTSHDYRDDLATIPAGSLLFDVYALD